MVIEHSNPILPAGTSNFFSCLAGFLWGLTGWLLAKPSL